ncbi:RHS repeat protein [Chitinimonas arctica]|uniref:RHS repeat protein n=1 Tax=Chitinimonas arctica TaxID=2594795 RepID=A0A516SAS5_9NEIS|nr:DUF6531 domain-containing protein [Chitinimonas arctica]QDQ25263.1 RHS repeat protein [Chitinimonas arctica]
MKRFFLLVACYLLSYAAVAGPGEERGYVYIYGPMYWMDIHKKSPCMGDQPSDVENVPGCKTKADRSVQQYLREGGYYNQGWSYADAICYRGSNGAPDHCLGAVNVRQGMCKPGWEYGWNNGVKPEKQYCRSGGPNGFCPAGFSMRDDGTCACPAGKEYDPQQGQCAVPTNPTQNTQDKTPPQDDCQCSIPAAIGDPIGLDRGRTLIDETDYAATGASSLAFTRHYDSLRRVPAGTAARGWDASGWRHNYDIRLFTRAAYNRLDMMLQLGQRTMSFRLLDGEPRRWQADADVNASLTELPGGGWQYRDGDDSVWTFDDYLQPVSQVQRNGYTLTFTTNANQDIFLVRDSFQRQLRIDYDGLLIKQVTPPSGKVITYGYEAGKLVSVSHADGYRRQYQYLVRVSPIANAPAAISDLIDENQKPFAHWEYDATTGLTIATWEAGKQNHYQVDQYQFDAQNQLQSVRFTDPLGVSHSYGQASQLDVTRPRQETRSGARAGDPVQTRSQTYDAQNNLASVTNFKGATTTYKYELARNLQIERIESAGTDKARTTRTEWWSNLRIPLAISAPSLRTTFVPDSKGNILSRTEQATLDPNGSQGFNAAPTGSARVWQYTYYPNGLLWTATEPDLSVSTFVYDAQGNLSQATDGAGLVTLYQDYTPAGQVGRIKQPDGVTITLGYDLRGRLKTRTVGSLVTTYSYHPTGQLSQVDTPDGRKLNYDYDTAHRLTVIRDNLGNRIVYTLDAMGNRKFTELQDSSNSLAQLVAQIDADRAPLARPTARTAS